MTRAIQPQGASMPRTPPRAVTLASAPWRISATAANAHPAPGGPPARRRLRCRRDGRTGLLYPRWCWFRGQPRRWHMRVMIEPYVEVTATLPVCLHLDGRLFVFELDGCRWKSARGMCPTRTAPGLVRHAGVAGANPRAV